jgi:hypothetical protein
VIYDADIEAAREYARRWRKGLPSDRWADGHVGSVMVARGIEKLAIALAEHIVAERQRGVDAMSTGEPEYSQQVIK